MPNNSEQRNDDNMSLFFARDLEHKESRIYSKEYPAIKFRQLFPMNNEGGPGVLNITYKMLDKTGTAQALADYADDFPRVNLSAIEVIRKIFPYGNSFFYSLDEQEAASRNNIPLDSAGVEAMRDAYERKLDGIASAGDSSTGLVGFNSDANIPLVVPTTSAGAGDDTWPNKTADEILADFALLYQTILTNTSSVYEPTVALMSPERLARLRQVRLPSTNSLLLNLVQDAFPGMELASWTKMSTASVAGAQRMSMYVKDSAVLEFREPVPFQLFPLERRGMKYVYNARGKTAGVMVRQPLACAHMDGI